tara:strand:- start:333 stop:671 length:339 start_codon:yes stop_codon:yes gene_type:complete
VTHELRGFISEALLRVASHSRSRKRCSSTLAQRNVPCPQVALKAAAAAEEEEEVEQLQRRALGMFRSAALVSQQWPQRQRPKVVVPVAAAAAVASAVASAEEAWRLMLVKWL